MAINQNIQNFYTQAERGDFSRDFLFRVTALNLQGLTLTDADLVYARAAKLPGRSITNIPVNYMGLQFNIPGNVTYPGAESYELEFYLDANSNLRNKFEYASRLVFDDATSTGNYITPNQNFFIELAQLDKALNPINYYKLVGASIRNIEEISYTIAEGKGDTVKLSTKIAYHYYEQPQNSKLVPA